MKQTHRLSMLLALLALVLGPIAFAEDAKESAPEAETPDPLAVENFTLVDPWGKKHSLHDYKGKWIVLEWTNKGCPYVKKHYESNNMQTLQKKYTEKGVVWLSICSSAEGKEGYMTPEAWKEYLEKVGAKATATLIDADGRVGRKMGAKVTPHMWVLDPKLRKVYEGAIDDKRNARKPEEIAEAKNYVAAALDAGMAGKEIEVPSTRPYG